MRLQKRSWLYGLGLVALTVLPIHAEEPVNRTIKMPARESYRKPDDKYGHEAGGFQRHVIITVSPAKFPYPLLKYRLNMDSTELESGNAAPLYSQAHAECEKIYVEAEKNWYASNEFFELKKRGASQEKILGELFRAVPLKPVWSNRSFPKSVSPEEEAKFYHSMEPVYRLLEKASRMRYADWGDMDYKEVFASLERWNNMRGLARYLSGKADWEIRNGKYEDAVKTLRIGIALGNHLAQAYPRTLVGMLVGIAIHGMMQEHIMTIVSQADGPNLYAALTQIVQPADALLSALQGELSYASQTGLPSFEDIDKASPEECRAKLENVIPRFLMPGADRWNSDFEKSRFAAAICTFCYPQARDRLLAQGRTAEEIERMSVYQVVTPYVFHEFKDAHDRLLVTSTFLAGDLAHRDCRSRKSIGKSPLTDRFLRRVAVFRVECDKDRMQATAPVV